MDPTVNTAGNKTITQPSASSPPWWRPAAGLTWQWQLSEPPVDLSIDAQVYDIDLFENDAAVVDRLHEMSRKAIGYISVGSWEDWRPDAGQFPAEVLGREYEGWPGERWLDIRQIDVLAPLLRKRLDLIRAKGFDAVEPDNIDIYRSRTGFPLTYTDQLTFARWLAKEAHGRGLAIGLKNAPDMVKDTLDLYDFAITEDCFAHGWGEEMLPFIQAGKPVFAAEYTDTEVDFEAACAWGKKHNIHVILKNRILTAWRGVCGE